MAERVSVIICAYNYAHFLRQCLTSVVDQTRAPDEIIIVDDGSHDETASLVSAFKNVCYLRQENAGKAAAFNHGFASATGDIICHLDADDFWAPQKLEHSLEVLLGAHAGVLTHNAFYVDAQGEFLYGSKPDANGRALPLHFSLREVLLMCLLYRPPNAVQGTLGVVNTVCVRRDAVADLVPLPEELGLAVDGALLLGAARRGLVYLPEKLSAYRHHENNQFVRNPKSLEFQRRLFRWVSHLPGAGGEYEMDLLEVLALQEDVNAALALSEQPLRTALRAAALPPKLLRLGLIPHWKQFALPAASLVRWRKIRRAFAGTKQ